MIIPRIMQDKGSRARGRKNLETTVHSLPYPEFFASIPKTEQLNPRGTAATMNTIRALFSCYSTAGAPFLSLNHSKTASGTASPLSLQMVLYYPLHFVF